MSLQQESVGSPGLAGKLQQELGKARNRPAVITELPSRIPDATLSTLEAEDLILLKPLVYCQRPSSALVLPDFGLTRLVSLKTPIPLCQAIDIWLPNSGFASA